MLLLFFSITVSKLAQADLLEVYPFMASRIHKWIRHSAVMQESLS